MAIESWELNQEHHTQRLREFRQRYGDADLPVGTKNTGPLKFPDIHSRLLKLLPFAPQKTLAFMSEAVYEGADTQPITQKFLVDERDITRDEWKSRAEAVVAAYYGTGATARAVAEAFSLKETGHVRSIVEDYLSHLWLESSEPLKVRFRGGKDIWTQTAKLSQPSQEAVEPDLSIPRFRDPSISGLVDGEPISRFVEFWPRVAKRHQEKAVEVVDGDLDIIVNAPRGTGKTMLFGERVRRLQIDRGFQSMMIDLGLSTHRYTDRASTSDLIETLLELKAGNPLRVVVDEPMAVLDNYPQVYQDLIEVLKKHELPVVVLNTGTSTQQRQEITDKLQEAGARLGFQFGTYELPRYLPSDLVRELLMTSNVDYELINFFYSPGNEILRAAAVFSSVDDIFPTKELQSRQIKNLADLRERLRGSVPRDQGSLRTETGELVFDVYNQTWSRKMLHRIGSKTAWLSMLDNLQAVSSAEREWAKSLPDFD